MSDRASLTNLARGAVIERFDDELSDVIENILDPNTDAKKSRTITLTVKITPDEGRGYGSVTVVCDSKMAPPKAVGAILYFGREDGEAIATEYDTRQPELPFDEQKGNPSIMHINRRAGNVE